jgi:thioredoxin reductase
MKAQYTVIIIGAGPAGIGAASALHAQGITDIIVLDRESDAGGVPRHCEHPTFGALAFKQPMKGSKFVQRILQGCIGVEIKTGATVVALLPNGHLKVSTEDGIMELEAQRIIIATGVRETPRHPRLVSGLRPQGIMTVGALQQFTYLRKQKSCTTAVLVGTELVSFSALWTLRNAGAKAAVMIEENSRVTAYRPTAIFAKLMGVEILYNTKISHIGGLNRVEYVEVVNRAGIKKRIECDAVIFSGSFVGEYTLIRSSHLQQANKTGCPEVDQRGRCSDPSYYAVGNMLHPADMGDQCYLEGLELGKQVVLELNTNASTKARRLRVKHDDNIQITNPSCIDTNLQGRVDINMRVAQEKSGMVTIKAGDDIIYQKKHRCMPARRIMLKDVDIKDITGEIVQLDIAIN